LDQAIGGGSLEPGLLFFACRAKHLRLRISWRPCPALRAKIFCISENRKSWLNHAVPCQKRGVSRSSRLAARDAMDTTVRLTKRAVVYGQAVWSCPLDAGVKLRNAICANDGG